MLSASKTLIIRRLPQESLNRIYIEKRSRGQLEVQDIEETLTCKMKALVEAYDHHKSSNQKGEFIYTQVETLTFVVFIALNLAASKLVWCIYKPHEIHLV